MARPRKPTALKALQGDPPATINRDEPRSPKGSGPCPDHLGDVGREAWRRVVDRLDEMGLLTLADAELVALYASTYEEWAEASADVKREGLTVTSHTGVVKAHPLLSTVKECRAQMTRLLSALGMSPTSRSSLHVQGKPEDDPILAFFDRHKPAPPSPSPGKGRKPKPKAP